MAGMVSAQRWMQASTWRQAALGAACCCPLQTTPSSSSSNLTLARRAVLLQPLRSAAAEVQPGESGGRGRLQQAPSPSDAVAAAAAAAVVSRRGPTRSIHRSCLGPGGWLTSCT